MPDLPLTMRAVLLAGYGDLNSQISGGCWPAPNLGAADTIVE